jgi:glycosyltransferase involved in cell wall biosynthesis
MELLKGLGYSAIMKLLIVTQKANIDDPILGFFHHWIEEFAKHFDSITVICLESGRYDLPQNVKVLSLGKESGTSRAGQIRHFYKYIWNEKKNYDAVFVHMNPIYAVLAGWFWKLSGKKVALWYTHKAVDLKLRIAERFVDIIFTAAAESFTLKTGKKRVVGHGIDVEKYASAPRTKVIGIEPISIISVGRITPIKGCETLVEAAYILKGKKFTVTFVGSPAKGSDLAYFDKVKSLVAKYDLGDIVSFVGDIRPTDMPAIYAAADLSVNLTPTGGLDKAVLESMAAGVPVLTSNTAFKEYFESAEKGLGDRLVFKLNDAQDLADKIAALIYPDSGNSDGLNSASELGSIGRDLQKVARARADVSALINKLSESILML